MRQILLLTAAILSFSQLYGQDNCSSAVNLCANSSITRSNIGSTVQGSDPALSCGDATLNNNVWFSVTAINNGTCTVTVNNIDNNPGLDMEVYTGSCGSLTTTGFCASGSSATGRTMNVSFPITTGTTYYIMVDGRNGNAEAFDIVATTLNNSIIARPDANFNADPAYGCVPLIVNLDNTATIYGGTNITYNWRIDGGAFISSSGADTNIVISSTGTHTVTQRVCNNECGCKTISQDVIGQTLVPSITVTPATAGCVGGVIQFDGNATIDPDPPFVDPGVTTWDWDFGDPASGVNNTASGQNVTHIFSNSGTNFTVTLTIDGTCGPQTITRNITLLPQPTVGVSGPASVCEGVPFDLDAIVQGNPNNYTYDWADPTYFACSTCQTSTLFNLTAGGPYTFTVTITDASGCTATNSIDVLITDIPIVSTDGSLTVCPTDAAVLNTVVSGGTGPYSYQWTPSAGLSSDTDPAPTTFNTNGTLYCVTVTDGFGCVSNQDCVSLSQYPIPTIDAAVSTICASSAFLQNTFTVNGASPGSTYSWGLSPDYGVIVSAAPDSSFIDVDFPFGVSATYTFTAIVTDATTGCIDTVTTTFTVTPGIQVNITGPTEVCEGFPFDLTADVVGNPALFTFDWTDPTYFACSTCQTSTVFNVIGGTTYTFDVLVMDGAGCTANATYDVTINEIPVVTTAGNLIVCPSEPAVLNTIISGGTSPYSYQWTPSAGLDSDVISNPTTFNTNGTTYCVVVVDGAGCQSNQDCVTLNQYPIPTLDAAIPTMCATSTNLQNTFTVNGAASGSSYSWGLSPDYGVITSAAPDSSFITVDFPFGAAATYVFTAIVTDANTGCIDTITTSFDVTDGVQVTVTGPTEVCEGLPFDLTADVVGDPTLFTYDWTDPSYFACSTCQTSTIFNVTAGTTYTFDVLVVDGSGCSGTASLDVTINENPVVTTAGNLIVCPSEPAVLNTIISGGSSPYNYQWTPSAGLDSDVISNPTTFNTNGTTYCVTVVDGAGCVSNQDCVTLNQYPLPTLDPALPTICATSTTLQNTFTVNGAASGSSYSWGLSADYGIITSAAPDSSFITVDFPFGVAATYNFVAIVTDALTGCIDTLVSNFDVTNGVAVTVTGPTDVCEGTPFDLTANVPGNPNDYTYDWTDPTYFACSTCQTSTLFNLTAGGPYTFTVTVNDTSGCAGIATIDVTINEIPVVVTAGNITVCSNQPAVLNTSVSGGSAPYSYQWSPSAGLDSDVSDTPTAYDTNGSTYCVTVTDAAGCQSSPGCVTINQYPLPTIVPTDPIVCATSPNPQNTFTVTGATPGSFFSWILSADYGIISGSAPDSSSITVDFPTGIAATYSFTAIVNDIGTGCIDTVSISFDVVTGLSMSVSGQTNICSGSSATLTVSGANTYAWTANPAYVFADSTLATQTVSPSVTTLFTIIGTAGTCQQSFDYILTVDANPYAEAAAIAPFCACSPINLDASPSTPGMIYNWTSALGNAIGDTTASITTAQPCTTDTFFLRVTDPATSCFSDTFVVANAIQKPSAVATINPNLICAGQTAIVNLDGTGSDTNGGTTYNWVSSDPSVLISDNTSLITDAILSDQTIFYLTVTDAFGCDSTTSDTLNVQPAPTITVSLPFLCTTDNPRTSVLSVLGASPGSFYDWNLIPACASPSTSNLDSETFDFSSCPAGIYDFNVTVIDAVTSCLNNLQASVTVVDGVTLALSADTVTICEGATATMAASGANTFAWTGGFTTDTISVSGLTAAGSPYYYVVTGFIGSCNSTDTIVVIVNPAPVVNSLNGLLAVCASDTATYFVSPTTGTYSWSVTGGVINSGQGTSSILVDWSTGGAGTVDLVVTNSFGCSTNAQTLNVTINARPNSVPVTGSTTACENTSGNYSVNPVVGSTYLWSVSGGTISGPNTGNAIAVNWTTPGVGVVSVIETNSAGCTGPASVVNLNINPRPTLPFVTGNQLLCENTQSEYVLTAVSGSTYSWSTTNAVSQSLNATSDTLSVNWGPGGNGTVSVVETNIFNCQSDTTTISIALIISPIAAIAVDSISICNNNSFQLQGIANTPTIRWYTDGTGTFSDTSIANPVYNASITDTGYIHLTMVVQNFPCANDTATMVVYHSAAPVLNVTATTTALCQGDTATVTATGGVTYAWLPGGETTDSIVVNPSIATTYIVTTANQFNCTSTDSVRINVIPWGIADAGSNQSICIFDTVQLSGSQQNAGGLIWSSSGDGVFIPNANTAAAQYVPGTNDTLNQSVNLYLTTTGACRNLTDTIVISIQGIPSINAGADTILTGGPTSNAIVPLNPTGVNIPGVQWTTTGTGTFTPSDTSLNAVYTPSSADYGKDSIVLSVTTVGSCQPASDFIVVDFSLITVPNVFTPYPASPGQNDYFVIPNLPPNSKLKVFDRWGMLVYTSDNYQNNWDGFGLESDTYYYIVETTNKSYKGWVAMMRD